MLRVVVLRKGGNKPNPRVKLVSKEPSPANFAVIKPAETVEKNP